MTTEHKQYLDLVDGVQQPRNPSSVIFFLKLITISHFHNLETHLGHFDKFMLCIADKSQLEAEARLVSSVASCLFLVTGFICSFTVVEFKNTASLFSTHEL